MPYFPTISSFLSPSEVIADPTTFYCDSCISFLHSVVYRNIRGCIVGPLENHEAGYRSWDWIKSHSTTSDFLNGSSMIVAGDSQARLIAVSLLELVMGPEAIERIRGDLFKRHSDYSVAVDEIGMKLDFVWAPYVANLTELVLQLKHSKSLPDVLVLGAGLWDMLHINNATEYGISLQVLRDSLLAFLPVSSRLDGGGGCVNEFKSLGILHLFWIGMSTLITSMLNTIAKRERMIEEMYNSYGNELRGSKLICQTGRPILKLDIRFLSELSGPPCTADGMHYNGSVYGFAVHILLNASLIKSDQKPLR